jgi:DNA-nicking Smr family endonuclease
MARDGERRAKRHRERVPTATEQQLWDQMTRDVTPLTTSRDRTPVDVPNLEPVPDDSTDAAPASMQPVSKRRSVETGQTPAKPKPAGPAPLAVDETAGVDRRTADRLKRGRLDIDARLDLHGMTRAGAQDALMVFLDRAQARDCRCVLVITGKGRRGDESGVLRSEVPRWLNMPHVRGKVVAVTQAQPRHGGGGAFYVLLRRRRGD